MALIQCHFFSQVLGLSSTMTVILPNPAGSSQGSTPASSPPKFPTLYLLHGLSDDHSIWQRRTSIERYVAPLNLAVVMPAVDRSFYTDMATGQRYGTFISEELPFLARSYFPLSAAREENYVAGLSMGGYGAFKLALTYPDRFAAAASLSGALDVVRLARAQEDNSSSEYRHIFGDSGNLADGPNDLFHLAAQISGSAGKMPNLYQWCGTDDFLYADNLKFKDQSQSLGLPLTYEEGPGGHDWACWDRQIQRVLEWLPGLRNK
jgi:putative tributyrin esterase